MKKSRIKKISLGLLILIIAIAAYTYVDIAASNGICISSLGAFWVEVEKKEEMSVVSG